MRATTREKLNQIISRVDIPVNAKQKVVNLIEDLEAEIESQHHEIDYLRISNDQNNLTVLIKS